MAAPTVHNPALVLNWNRFCSDTIVQFVKMQADVLREITPDRPVTTNLRALRHRFDHFDLAEQLDFVSIESTARSRPSRRRSPVKSTCSARSKKPASARPMATPVSGSWSKRPAT
jgi:hypothetical protein